MDEPPTLLSSLLVPPPHAPPSLCEVWLVQGSLSVSGHVGPMACSGMEASEGCLLSGPLLRGLLQPHASGSWALLVQSCKIITINAACLLKALKVG